MIEDLKADGFFAMKATGMAPSYKGTQITKKTTGGNTWISFNTLRDRNGKKVPFELKDTKGVTSIGKAYQTFLEQYMGYVHKDGGVLVVMDGEPRLEYSKQIEDKMAEKTNDMIMNPNSDKALSLLNEKVFASNKLYNFDETAVKGVLIRLDPKDDKPFIVETNGEALNFIAVKEAPKATYQPYKLADPKVRSELMLRVYRSKPESKTYAEGIVHVFTYSSCSWKINGISANSFLECYVWEDGTPCGVLEEEA